MFPRCVRLVGHVVLPFGVLAVLGLGSVSSASAQGPTCPKFGCAPPVPNVSVAPQQLIINSGFENSSTGWALDPGASTSSTVVHCGSSSLAMHTYDTGSNSYF